MLALFRVERAVQALDVYEDGRRLLSNELGVDPSAQLQRIHRSVLLGEDPGGELGSAHLPGARRSGRRCPALLVALRRPGLRRRVAELDRAADAAGGRTASPLSWSNRLGDIGKTVFATSLAHR